MRVRDIKHLLIVAAVVLSNLPGVLYSGASILAQTARQLPSRIEADQTPADITITGGFLQVAGTGDFNGDGVDDFLVKYERSVGETAPGVTSDRKGRVTYLSRAYIGQWSPRP